MSKVDLSDVASALKVDASSLTLHNVQKAGASTGTYVVSSGSDNYSVSVGSDGSVALNKTTVTYDDSDNGVTGATSDQFIKVASNASGDAVGFVTIQGKTSSLVQLVTVKMQLLTPLAQLKAPQPQLTLQLVLLLPRFS